jgi:hypothetical protein
MATQPHPSPMPSASMVRPRQIQPPQFVLFCPSSCPLCPLKKPFLLGMLGKDDQLWKSFSVRKCLSKPSQIQTKLETGCTDYLERKTR